MEVALSRHLEQNSSLQLQILSSNDRIAQLESMNCQLKGTVQQREEMTTQARDEIHTLQRRLRYDVLHLPSLMISKLASISVSDYNYKSVARDNLNISVIHSHIEMAFVTQDMETTFGYTYTGVFMPFSY